MSVAHSKPDDWNTVGLQRRHCSLQVQPGVTGLNPVPATCKRVKNNCHGNTKLKSCFGLPIDWFYD